MASVTLKQGIEQILKQAIPRIKAVVDATDHALGNNPFYASDKGGESPFQQGFAGVRSGGQAPSGPDAGY